MILDYETLKVVWWLLIGLLLIGFVVIDGFGMGAAILLPFLGRNDEQRRAIIKTIGAHWDGNQVWFIMAGGAIFTAWPAVHGAAFADFYAAILLVLFALLFRPVAFDFRGKIEHPRRRRSWDWAVFAGGVVPALVFGLAFGNLLHGVPFQYDDFMRPSYTGSWWGLLNPFALLTGVVSLSMLGMHGAVWLQMHADEPVESRARTAVKVAAIVLIISFAIAGLWVAYGMQGYRVVSITDIAGAPDPTAKTVVATAGAWLGNYERYPWTTLAPIIGFAGAVLTIVLSGIRRPGLAFVTSA
ncbi:MAG: cytochrome d ubiquinol oxidase subunit II, partial [Gammaproteobacteria bacterium]